MLLFPFVWVYFKSLQSCCVWLNELFPAQYPVEGGTRGRKEYWALLTKIYSGVTGPHRGRSPFTQRYPMVMQ
jgi:hypothetical protein